LAQGTPPTVDKLQDIADMDAQAHILHDDIRFYEAILAVFIPTTIPWLLIKGSRCCRY
jgi:hypothetical protein